MLPQSPLDGCMMFEGNLLGRVPLIVRGGCMFVEKVSWLVAEYHYKSLSIICAI